MGITLSYVPTRDAKGRYISQWPQRRNLGATRTHAALRLHPNFKFPPLPRSRSQRALAEFVLEAVARFVSPPKVEGESEEFACEDIADAIRTKLTPEILAMLGFRDP